MAQEILQSSFISQLQKNRYQSGLTQEFYYLGKDSQAFYISGSTKKAYKLQLQLSKTVDGSHYLTCDCPDGKKLYHICKHSCYLISKISKFSTNQLIDYFVNRIFDQQSMQMIIDQTNFLENSFQSNNPNINQDLSQIFQQKMKLSQPDSSKVVIKNDICSICYDDLNTQEKNSVARPISQCSKCKNQLHLQCIKRWVSKNQTCIYCREPWSDSLQDNKDNGYIQL